MRRTLLVDIDGTLAKYKKGTYDPQNIGEPLPNAVEKMKALEAKGFELIIFSTRKKSVGEFWLNKHGIPYSDYIEKPLNWLIVDDRALTFKGDWDITEEEINNFKPWHENEKD